MTYLDFEKPIQELETEVFKLKEIASKSKVNLDDKIKELESNIKAKTAEIYNNLNAWQRVQVSRHPERPYTLAYINAQESICYEQHIMLNYSTMCLLFAY